MENQNVNAKSFSACLEGFSYDEFVKDELIIDMEYALTHDNDLAAELAWFLDNKQEAFTILLAWYLAAVEEAEAEEAEYNRSWRNEIAREAGMMYGMQGYNDVMGLDTSDDGNCPYCPGGNGHNCC
tara:strand:+ start:2830 stop:3207 length:378 start_codon:yes stop_codon:yes gene_type:complete